MPQNPSLTYSCFVAGAPSTDEICASAIFYNFGPSALPSAAIPDGFQISFTSEALRDIDYYVASGKLDFYDNASDLRTVIEDVLSMLQSRTGRRCSRYTKVPRTFFAFLLSANPCPICLLQKTSREVPIAGWRSRELGTTEMCVRHVELRHSACGWIVLPMAGECQYTVLTCVFCILARSQFGFCVDVLNVKIRYADDNMRYVSTYEPIREPLQETNPPMCMFIMLQSGCLPHVYSLGYRC